MFSHRAVAREGARGVYGHNSWECAKMKQFAIQLLLLSKSNIMYLFNYL
jgi:hypothetical protein